MCSIMIQHKKGRIALFLIFVIVIVLSSAAALSLVKFGIVTPKYTESNFLNAEFIPMERAGSMAIKEFQFCSAVDENYQCIDPQEKFSPGDSVYFTFVVESSV